MYHNEKRAKRNFTVAPPLIFFSTRQGRQSNCVLTVEIARFMAERLGRRLVLPACHTSPLGEQACAVRPDIPPQRQIVVPFALPKVLQARDLARCRAPAASAWPLLTPSDIKPSATFRNVTCLEVVTKGTGRPYNRNPCASEISGDHELRTELPLRFAKHLTIPIVKVLAAKQDKGGLAALRFYDTATLTHVSLSSTDDIFLYAAFDIFSAKIFSKWFGLCALPQETKEVVRMKHHLQRSLGFSQYHTLCMHWRAEDFHHPNTVKKYSRNSTAAAAAEQALRHASRTRTRSVLVLSNARFEALHELLTRLRAAGLDARSPRELDQTSFGCTSGYVYGTIAEMLACSEAHTFLGSGQSTYSSHIYAMRERRGATNASTVWLPSR